MRTIFEFFGGLSILIVLVSILWGFGTIAITNDFPILIRLIYGGACLGLVCVFGYFFCDEIGKHK